MVFIQKALLEFKTVRMYSGSLKESPFTLNSHFLNLFRGLL